MKTVNQVPITVGECNQITTEISMRRKKYDKLMKISLIVWVISIPLIVFSLWCVISSIISGIVFLVFFNKSCSIRIAEIMMIKIICDALSEGYTYEETLKKLGL